MSGSRRVESGEWRLGDWGLGIGEWRAEEGSEMGFPLVIGVMRVGGIFPLKLDVTPSV